MLHIYLLENSEEVSQPQSFFSRYMFRYLRHLLPATTFRPKNIERNRQDGPVTEDLPIAGGAPVSFNGSHNRSGVGAGRPWPRSKPPGSPAGRPGAGSRSLGSRHNSQQS